MNKLFLISFVVFACFACKDDCNCDDDEGYETELWEEEVHVTVTGPDVVNRKVYVKTCAGQSQGSGPKDPVSPDATSYNFTFDLDVEVQTDEEGVTIPGDAICYKIYGAEDPNCDIENPEDIWLKWDDYVAVDVVYTCD